MLHRNKNNVHTKLGEERIITWIAPPKPYIKVTYRVNVRIYVDVQCV